MTYRSDELTLEDKIVVVFDICSSSTILEELIVRQDLLPMRNLLITLKKFLKHQSEVLGFETYKFIGDGWIILFPPHISGITLVNFLEELSRFFMMKLKTGVIPNLEHSPPILGLTFGVDTGSLVRFTMMTKREYVGRPLNIASRLQSAIKDKDDNPANKVLFSKPSFNQLGIDRSFRKTRPVTRTLRNIRHGKRYACVKMWLKV